MVKLVFDKQFVKSFKKLDTQLKDKVRLQIKKISISPEIGKPMKYGRKGTREVYVKPFRLSYLYENDVLFIAALYHKDKQ